MHLVGESGKVIWGTLQGPCDEYVYQLEMFTIPGKTGHKAHKF